MIKEEFLSKKELVLSKIPAKVKAEFFRHCDGSISAWTRSGSGNVIYSIRRAGDFRVVLAFDVRHPNGFA